LPVDLVKHLDRLTERAASRCSEVVRDALTKDASTRTGST
jgi:metal-responsive CopG/Arc/MetJ family transcriptional regulator